MRTKYRYCYRVELERLPFIDYEPIAWAEANVMGGWSTNEFGRFWFEQEIEALYFKLAHF